MTIRHMKIFIQVYSVESITKAAKLLHMTQPAVTRAVQEIESYYGVCLFERINHRLSRTAAGEAFYIQALHIAETFDRMEKELRNWDEIGKLRIGATNTLGSFFLPEALSQFRERYPNLKVTAVVTNADALQHRLSENQLDLALIEGSVCMHGLHAEPFTSDRLLLVLPLEHELVRKDKICAADLRNYPLLLREKGSTTRTLLEHFFSLHHMELIPVMESCNPQVIIYAVQRGLGISFLPEEWVKQYAKEGTLVVKEMEEKDFVRENYIVWHENKFLTGAMCALIELIRTQRMSLQKPVSIIERNKKL